MSRFRKIILILLPLMLLIFLGAGKSEEDARVIYQDEKVENDIFYSGIYFENNGMVAGNLIINSQKALINGLVEGNVAVYGEQVQVNGHITGDLLAFSADIVINGQIDGNVYLISSNQVLLENNSQVARSAYIFARNVEAYGKITRDATILAADTMVIRGLIEGSLHYNAGEESIAGSSVKGQVQEEEFFDFSQYLYGSSVSKVLSFFSFIFSNLVIWFLLNFLFKETKIKTLVVFTGNKFKVFFVYGLLSIVAGLFLSLFLIMSTVSLAFGLILLFMIMSMIYLSNGIFIVALSEYLGSKIKLWQRGNSIMLVLILSFVMGVILAIPIVNILVGMIVEIFGFGLLVGSFLIKLKYIEKGQIID